MIPRDRTGGRLFDRCPERSAQSVRRGRRPIVPTLDELGFRDIDVSFWHGMWAPKGTPQNIIAKLDSAIRISVADP